MARCRYASFHKLGEDLNCMMLITQSGGPVSQFCYSYQIDYLTKYAIAFQK